jgi:endonuclease III
LGRIEFAPIPELTDVIRPGGLANQKAPRLQSTLRKIREERATTRSNSWAT